MMNEYEDFEYCGKRLSDFGSMLGSVGGTGGIEDLDGGNKLTFIDVETPYLKRVKNITSKYGECLERTYYIVKRPCESIDGVYTMQECNAIMRWLNQQSYRKFRPIYSDPYWQEVYYRATFNIDPIIFQDEVVGFTLTMKTDAPFGYYPDVERSGSCPFTIEDTSDEIGFIYPIVEITSGSALAELRLINNRDEDHYTSILNVAAGETIYLNGNNKSISSTIPHSELYQDFNYNFPKLINSMSADGVDDRQNIFMATDGNSAVNATIKISYTPICKFGLL